MNLDETIILCRTVRALAPAQRFEAETPDVWMLALDGLSLAECQAAAVLVARSQAFIAPSDLIREVVAARRGAARARTAAVEANPGLIPAADPDNPREYVRAIRAGRFVDKPNRVVAGNRVSELVSGVAKRLPHVPGSSV